MDLLEYDRTIACISSIKLSLTKDISPPIYSSHINRLLSGFFVSIDLIGANYGQRFGHQSPRFVKLTISCLLIRGPSPTPILLQPRPHKCWTNQCNNLFGRFYIFLCQIPIIYYDKYPSMSWDDLRVFRCPIVKLTVPTSPNSLAPTRTHLFIPFNCTLQVNFGIGVKF